MHVIVGEPGNSLDRNNNNNNNYYYYYSTGRIPTSLQRE
jgi:hypothetical protein